VEGGPVTLAQRGLCSSSTCATAIPIWRFENPRWRAGYERAR
jgi:hypothetical protein